MILFFVFITILGVEEDDGEEIEDDSIQGFFSHKGGLYIHAKFMYCCCCFFFLFS